MTVETRSLGVDRSWSRTIGFPPSSASRTDPLGPEDRGQNQSDGSPGPRLPRFNQHWASVTGIGRASRLLPFQPPVAQVADLCTD